MAVGQLWAGWSGRDAVILQVSEVDRLGAVRVQVDEVELRGEAVNGHRHAPPGGVAAGVVLERREPRRIELQLAKGRASVSRAVEAGVRIAVRSARVLRVRGRVAKWQAEPGRASELGVLGDRAVVGRRLARVPGQLHEVSHLEGAASGTGEELHARLVMPHVVAVVNETAPAVGTAGARVVTGLVPLG